MKKIDFKLTKYSINAYYLLLITFGVLFRIPFMVANYSHGIDDGIYAMSAKHVANGNIPFKDVFSSQGGWFLELLALPMRIFGDSHFSSRIVPCISGLIIALASFEIAKRFIAAKPAFFCALTICLTGTVVRATAPITSDGLMVAISLLCILFTFKFIENSDINHALYLGALLGLGCAIKSIFMIPTIIFIVYATFKTPIVKRFVALSTSIIIFALPFLLFGFKEVWNQSIVYHLEKDDSLNLISNIEKMSSTFSTLDLLIFILFFGFIVLSTYRYIGKSKNRLAVTNDIKSLWIYVLATFFLLSVQTPLFRNHLVIFVPGIGIVLFIHLSEYFNKKNANLVFSIILLISIFFTFRSLLDDNQFRLMKNSTKYEVLLSNIKSNKGAIVLTNDVGAAFDANKDIPIGLEDTSMYRFKSKNENLKINSDTFAKYLQNNDTCAVVLNTSNENRTFDIEAKMSTKWKLISNTDSYKVWTRSC